MADEELELDVNQAKGNKTTTILLIVLIVLVLVMGGVGAWLFLGKDSGGGEESSDVDGKAENVLKPLHYLSLVPEFVVNFGPGSKVRYLQVDLQVSTRDENALVTINTYRPVLRNDILVLLSGLSFDELSQRGGKEALQASLLNTINKIVVDAMQGEKNKEKNEKQNNATNDKQKAGGIAGPVENVYFTSFIMQ
ncbi:MAG: flagellar basal body-associated FliL family protein [Gammaproteobacteria bacterium]|nr:flagellar basal body-associated FliL family protein [Gammaproteobacteria bacterium]